MTEDPNATRRRPGRDALCPRAVGTTRRDLVRYAGAAAGGVALGGWHQARAGEPVTEAPSSATSTAQGQPFYGPHQAGVLTPRPATGLVAAFDVLATSRAELERLFRTLTERCAFLMRGGPIATLDPRFPPPDSGLLGSVVQPDDLTMTVAVGASLFDDRFGLAAHRPSELRTMAGFANDALERERCHGDLLLQICSNTADTNIHALRDIIKTMPDLLLLRWKQEGTVPVRPAGAAHGSARNFLGFKDGSANPDVTDRVLMERIVWVDPGRGEPAWTVGGTYHVVRLIRMFVERWDRTPLREQETIFGRDKMSGAPLGLPTRDEFTDPAFATDPHGKRIPLDSHIRLANPRKPGTDASLILRRPFNYSAGVTRAGQLDMGMLFICFQGSLEAGFLTVQGRLNGEPLEEYIKPVGGGYFFTLPGVAAASGYLGQSLIEAA